MRSNSVKKMKKSLFVCALAALMACAEERLEPRAAAGAAVVGRPSGAVAGTLAVKLTERAAEAVGQTVGQAKTRSGLEPTDAVLDRIGAVGFERIFPYDELFEEQHRAAGLHCWYRIRFDERVPLEEAGALLRADSCIAVVEFTRACRPVKPRRVRGAQLPDESPAATRAGLPANDPMLVYQWHYDNRGGAFLGGSTVFTQAVEGMDVDLFEAWKLCTGDPRVVVAVLDEPIQTTHPDLEANVWENAIDPQRRGLHGYNFYGDTPELDWKSYETDPTAADVRDRYLYADHGTHVAGTVAAVNGNNRGVCGIAGGRGGRGGVRVMSCQILGYGKDARNYDAERQALVYAADRGAVIAQNSWGFADDLTESEWNGLAYGSLRAGIDYFIEHAGANNPRFPDAPLKGGLVIFAAGNSGDRIGDAKTWPAAYGPVVAVGALDWGGRPAYYTNYGSWVDVAAPGGDAYTGQTSSGQEYGANALILSTVLQDPEMTFLDGRTEDRDWCGYDFSQGTSMACPHVAGVAALGLSYAAQNGRQFTPAEFRALLLASVYGVEEQFTGTKRYYYSDDFGYAQSGSLSLADYRGKMGGGCIDAFKLLLAVKGTPAIRVKPGEVRTVDFAQFFGGTKSSVTLLSATFEAPQELGLTSSAAVFEGTKIAFDCPKQGVSMLTIRARAGDTEIEREFAVVARTRAAGNGGWL